MTSLLLLRHAKSSWEDRALADFDRPLSPRGEKAAPRMGREMARRGWQPDLALVSPAARTRQTWQLVATELRRQPAVRFPETLYAATAQDILAVLRQSSADTILVVGHNPGLETLALTLADHRSNRAARARIMEKFPTAALACFAFDGEWSALTTATLEDFLRPGDLEDRPEG